MSREELKTKLLSDLSQLNLPIYEVDLFIRPFSKTFYGRYFPVYNDTITRPKIYIYPYENENEEGCSDKRHNNTDGNFIGGKEDSCESVA